MKRLAYSLLPLALAACAAPTPVPNPTGPYLQDDFSDPNSGWDTTTSAEGTLAYAEGHYRVTVNAPNVYVWGTPGLELTDLVLEATAQHTGGPVDNEFGLLCRYTRNGDQANFYFGVISSDGYFAVGKVTPQATTILAPEIGSPQPSAAIVTEPQATNQLRLSCVGDHIAFYINDTLAGEFTDPDHTHGDVGLLAASYSTGGVQIDFDQVVVAAP